MFKRGYFKVEEIGTTGNAHRLYFKGKKRSLFEDEELVRSMSVFSRRKVREIISITEGKLDREAEFARNVFKLAGNGIKEIRIREKEIRRDGKVGRYAISDLKFLDNSSISGVLPGHGLKYLLACKGIGNGGDIYCHKDLYEPPKNLHDEKRREEAIKRNKIMKNYYVFFKKIEDIGIEDNKPEVHVNEDEYEKLSLDQILGHYLIMGAAFPRTITYTKGSFSKKNYGIPFPLNRVTIEKFEEGRGLDTARVIYNEPHNLFFQLDSTSIIDSVMKRADIEIESIYVDGTIKTHVRNRDLGNLILYDPRSAKIILKKGGKIIVTPAPGDKAISLSYLNSKDIWIRNLTGSYVA